MYLSAWADTTKYRRLGGLNKINLFSHYSGGNIMESQDQGLAGLVSDERSLPR